MSMRLDQSTMDPKVENTRYVVMKRACNERDVTIDCISPFGDYLLDVDIQNIGFIFATLCLRFGPSITRIAWNSQFLKLKA
jgi:hypothetical protein